MHVPGLWLPGVIVASRFAASWKEAGMIAVFVTFDSDMLDEGVVRKVASEAKGTFEGMPGLRNKFFTLAENHQQATNVYVWGSEQAAREFFSDQLLDQVTGLYGVRPRIEFAEVLELVDNT